MRFLPRALGGGRIKYMKKKQSEKLLSRKDIEELLNQQTLTILSAVDEKLAKQETRINQKFDRLMTTLDKFLKRLTDIEDEFTIMKLDLNRMKRVIKEKLGVDLT